MADEEPKIEAVEYRNFPRPNWYARITYPDGRTWHSEPWLTGMAADFHVASLRARPRGFMARHPWQR